MVLAELVHCHQLLAEALNSQVVVPPSLKALAISLTSPQNQAALSRRLKIGAKPSSVDGPEGSIRRADVSHPEALVASKPQANGEIVSQRSQVQAPMVTSGGGSIKPQGLDLERPQLANEVPEYLVGQRSGNWRIPMAIGAMIFLLSVLAWQALGPLNNVRDLFVASNLAEDNSASNEPQKNTLEANTDDAQTTSNLEDETAATKPNSSPTPSESDNTSKVPSNSDAVNPTVDPASTPQDLPKSDGSNPEVSNPVSAPPNTDLNVNAFRWTPGTEDARSVILVRKSVAGTTSLNRLAANTPIPADAEIIVPPSMRPMLNLADNCSWSVCGPTLMQLSQNENVTINTFLCRALAKAGTKGRKVTIVAPVGSVELQFGDATSMAAVEVAFRPVSHGPITDKLAFKPYLIIVAVEGQVTVTPTREAVDSKSVRLVVGEGVAMSDGQPIEFELGAIPAWYRAGNDRPLDSLAAADMHKLIHGLDDVNVPLTAMCSDSRPETAALAIQAKMLTGDWTSFASDFLNNELMSSHWLSALGLAEQLIASQDQNAEAVRNAFEAADPGRGDALFALLAGSGNAQPKELVELLGSNKLDERVLAAHQLRRLTGKDMGFQPSFPNRAVLQQWRRAIASAPPLSAVVDPLWEAKKPALEK